MSAQIAQRALAGLEAEGALRHVDTAFAALLQQRLQADAQVALAGALAMRAIALGHSGFALEHADRLLDALGTSAELPPTATWADALHDSPWVGAVATAEQSPPALLSFENGRVSLLRYARYEQALAVQLHARCGQHADVAWVDAAQPAAADASAVTSRLQRLFDLATLASGDALDRQALAAALALRRHLLLITGGPGTGKTSTVARMLALLVEAARSHGQAMPRIALAAPTGRAAVRLAEAIDSVANADLAAGRIDAELAAAIPRQARTLHRLLGWQPGRVAFRHNAAHPLPYDIVIVDEASMVDLPLMAKLVAAVAPQARLILLGDPDQLPAVEAGDVLGSLCAASGDGLSMPAHDAVALARQLGHQVPTDDTPTPLAGCRVHLQHGWRQAQSETLRNAAIAVRGGDRDLLFASLRAEDPALTWQQGDVAALSALLHESVLPAFLAVRDAPDPQIALQRARELRVLTALRRGPFGAEHWNAWCATALAAREPYFHGRLVMVTANSQRHQLYNGDLGIVWHGQTNDSRAQAQVWFECPNGLRAWRATQLPEHVSAFATTVHKAQGSEFDRVLLILPPAGTHALARELLYTALTRARRQVWVWASEAALEEALMRRTWRDSGLLARLRALGEA